MSFTYSLLDLHLTFGVGLHLMTLDLHFGYFYLSYLEILIVICRWIRQLVFTNELNNKYLELLVCAYVCVKPCSFKYKI